MIFVHSTSLHFISRQLLVHSVWDLMVEDSMVAEFVDEITWMKTRSSGYPPPLLLPLSRTCGKIDLRIEESACRKELFFSHR